MKHLYIRIPDDLHARVKEASAIKGISMNQLVVDALGSWLDSVHLAAKTTRGGAIVTFAIPKEEWERVEKYLKEKEWTGDIV